MLLQAECGQHRVFGEREFLSGRRSYEAVKQRPLQEQPQRPQATGGDLAEGFLTNLQKTQLNERGDADFAYANDFGRFRTSVVRQRLGVDLVLEGSVMREGKRLRITADLIRVRDDATMWSARYDREVGDLLTIEDEVSRSIVNQLRLKKVHEGQPLEGPEKPTASAPPTPAQPTRPRRVKRPRPADNKSLFGP